ncbi:MAG TPA: hypothetical protein VFF79_08070 [Conexibacter sp.]|jgi:hypothetical protein|nr:hypothetical protein [Conexibacter sp.]
MLFDLQSRGRRNVVKVIYLGLAVLMGGGLILFGIGTGGTGGLFDAFTGGSSSTSAQVSSAEKQAARAVRLHPQDPQAWAELTRARYQTAGLGGNYDQTTGTFTTSGRAKLAITVSAWQRYLKLAPQHPDATLARLMAQAYSEAGLNDPAQAATALEIVTQEQPSAQAYSQLAQYAYLADQMRKGDLAAGKAVQLAPPAQQRLVRTQLASVKTQVLRAQVQRAAQQGGVTSGG